MARRVIIDALCHSWPVWCLNQRLCENFSSFASKRVVEIINISVVTRSLFSLLQLLESQSWSFRRLPVKLLVLLAWSSVAASLLQASRMSCGAMWAPASLMTKSPFPVWTPQRGPGAFFWVCHSLWSPHVTSCLVRRCLTQHTVADSRVTRIWHGGSHLAGHVRPQQPPEDNFHVYSQQS